MTVAVVIASGPDLPSGFVVPDGATVIAADGGADYGVAVDLVVGDMDSVSAGALERAGSVQRHPADKDATDLELALRAALGLGASRVVVLGSAGGRLDHLLGSLLLLASDEWAGVEVDAFVGDARVWVVRGTRELEAEPGALVSLLALGGPAEGVTTDGLQYPLDGDALGPGSSRGISNVFVTSRARVTVDRGVVLAVRP